NRVFVVCGGRLLFFGFAAWGAQREEQTDESGGGLHGGVLVTRRRAPLLMWGGFARECVVAGFAQWNRCSTANELAARAVRRVAQRTVAKHATSSFRAAPRQRSHSRAGLVPAVNAASQRYGDWEGSVVLENRAQGTTKPPVSVSTSSW